MVYGVAIVGLGRAGRFHLTSVLNMPNLELLYVIDPVIDVAKENLAKFGAPSSVKVLSPKVHAAEIERDVWANSKVEIIICAAPTFEHENCIKTALRRGKHVFSEKPLSFSLQGSQECFDEARRANKVLMTGFQRRFDSSFRELHDKVQAGAIGDVHIVRSISRDNPIPSIEYLKISHGIFNDCVIHDLDMMLWVLKKRPTEVFAYAVANYNDIAAIGDVDTVVCLLKFEDGTLGQIDVSRNACYGYDQRLEVLGRQGMLTMDNHPATSVTLCKREGLLASPYQHSFPVRYKAAYKAEMEHFVAVLDGQTQLEVREDEVMLALRVCEALEQSHKTGKKVALSYERSRL